MLEHLSAEPDLRQLFSREAYAANKWDTRGGPGARRRRGRRRVSIFGHAAARGRDRARALGAHHRALSVAEVAVLMADVLDVLACATRTALCTGTSSQRNLFLEASGRVRVFDFGIARHVGASASASLTVRVIGTPAFIPPEQAIGIASPSAGSDGWAVRRHHVLALVGRIRAPGRERPSSARRGGHEARAFARRCRAGGARGQSSRSSTRRSPSSPKIAGRPLPAMRVALVAAVEEALGEPLDAITPAFAPSWPRI